MRSSEPAFAPVAAGRDHSLFETKGSLLREETGAPEIQGEHRVILHTIEGQVKRVLLRDSKLGDETVGLEAQPGAIERIPRPRIKAIFFMLPAGQKAPPPTGDIAARRFATRRPIKTSSAIAGIRFATSMNATTGGVSSFCPGAPCARTK